MLTHRQSAWRSNAKQQCVADRPAGADQATPNQDEPLSRARHRQRLGKQETNPACNEPQMVTAANSWCILQRPKLLVSF